MTKSLFAASLAGALALAVAARAQTAALHNPAPDNAAPDNNPAIGKHANTFILRQGVIGVIPENSSSSISVIGGNVTASSSAAPEVDISYFITHNIAVELLATTTRSNITAHNTALGGLPVGSVQVLPPTLTVQYHFMPHERFSPYVGVGLTGGFFFDEHPSRPTINQLRIDNNVGVAVKIGFDYNFTGNLFASFAITQILLDTTAHINGGAITAKVSLNPIVIGAGNQVLMGQPGGQISRGSAFGGDR